MSSACTPDLVGMASLVLEILLLSKMAKFPFRTISYSPCNVFLLSLSISQYLSLFPSFPPSLPPSLTPSYSLFLSLSFSLQQQLLHWLLHTPLDIDDTSKSTPINAIIISITIIIIIIITTKNQYQCRVT